MVTGDRGPSRKPSLLESSTTSVGSKKGSARKSSKGSSSSGRTSPKRKKDSPRKQKGTELFPYKSFDSEWTHAKWKAESRQYHLREYQREISRRMRGAFSRRGASGSTSPHGDGKTLDETLAEAKAAPSEAPTGGAAPAYPAAKTRFSRETGIGYGYSHSAPSPPPEPAPSPAPAEVDPLNDPERPRLGERRPSMVGEMIEHLRTRSMSIAGQNPYGPPQGLQPPKQYKPVQMNFGMGALMKKKQAPTTPPTIPEPTTAPAPAPAPAPEAPARSTGDSTPPSRPATALKLDGGGEREGTGAANATTEAEAPAPEEGWLQQLSRRLFGGGGSNRPSDRKEQQQQPVGGGGAGGLSSISE